MTDDTTASLTTEERLDGPVTMPSDASGWWERERAQFVRSRLEALTERGQRILDVGCGRGDMLDTAQLADRWCVNVDSHLWEEWAGQRQRVFVCAEADALPFRDGAFDLVGSFDVLEHIPDDRAAIAEQQRVAAAEAPIVVAVPADPRLWSTHDDAVGHLRRYDRSSLAGLARSIGAEVAWCSHFFSFLWLPAYVFRNSPVRQSQQGKTTSIVGRVAESVIGLVARLERAVLRRGWRLPFGSSMWAEIKPLQASRSR